MKNTIDYIQIFIDESINHNQEVENLLSTSNQENIKLVVTELDQVSEEIYEKILQKNIKWIKYTARNSIPESFIPILSLGSIEILKFWSPSDMSYSNLTKALTNLKQLHYLKLIMSNFVKSFQKICIP